MPTITFVTPPGRPSVLRATSGKQEAAQDSNSMHEPAPLTFGKRRILPVLTTSPEPAKDAFEQPPQRASLDQPSSSRTVHDDTRDHKRPSLLSAAMSSSGTHPHRSLSTTSSGILRKAQLEDGSHTDDRDSRSHAPSTDAVNPAPRARLHFVEPHKEATHHTSARIPHDARTEESSHASTSAAPDVLANADNAPRKRSLVIQEHADVIERVAERAARQANNTDTQAPDHPPHTRHTVRSRQHSASSAGEETASTRSSWAVRSSSRGSSVATSPTVVSDVNTQELSDFDLNRPARDPKPPANSSVTPIFHSTDAKPDAQPSRPPPPAPATSSRKLVFVDPPPPRPRHDAPPPQASKLTSAATSSKAHMNAVSHDDGHDAHARKALSFAACPKPERPARLSPAHATRRAKKLSASPAPHKLGYPQRLRGIRGTDPIRSPAPDRVVPLTHVAAEHWEAAIHDPPSSEGSGYSEDEEDDDDDQDDDDDDDDSQKELGSEQDDDEQKSSSSVSDQQSLAESAALASQDDAIARANAAIQSGGAHQAARALTPVLDLDSSAVLTGRRHSTSALLQLQTAHAGPSVPLSPPRVARPSRSTQASPRQGASRAGRRLQPKESLSHPMCFLPDAFEDSAPATPTEPDSDGYEPPRANLLHGWLSEGGSATSSRRASWQQPLSPALRPGAGEQEAVPITLPPFRRSRERTAQCSVTSDDERASRSLGGNAAFIRESALGRSLSTAPLLGVSVPDGRPERPVMWKQLSHVERPASGLGAYRRASHSLEPRLAKSAYTSPIGSYTARAAGVKQRATSMHMRALPVVAQTQRDVSGAASPRRDDAQATLKHHLAPVRSEAERDDEAPGNAARYWTERLASLAHAMGDELASVGQTVLGYEARANANAHEE
ncbi:uncharacterized protein PAN0_021c6027 [Moesziomyces antarcticus]|uniref:Uncharacterized protein n=2 Tax=Pseudozyma antarctica TaxID=84753 RepID=A0A5C3FZI1_PSEA2|nr:uncharacterized protein PAN0_021c6027 [Moesziomyces antarcticus]GAK67798.1 conserved hypothetical protein [Moesziomyces antarcticus]SPO48959.1 uncharacterized protein PSANT_06650 [Moesziomyces antarcticus]